MFGANDWLICFESKQNLRQGGELTPAKVHASQACVKELISPLCSASMPAALPLFAIALPRPFGQLLGRSAAHITATSRAFTASCCRQPPPLPLQYRGDELNSPRPCTTQRSPCSGTTRRSTGICGSIAPRPGRPKNDSELVASEKQQFAEGQHKRNTFAGKISKGLRRFGLGLIHEKLSVTQHSPIAMHVQVMNLKKLLELPFDLVANWLQLLIVNQPGEGSCFVWPCIQITPA